MINNLVRKSIEVDKKNITPLWEIKQEDECIIKLSLYRQSKAFDITGQALRLGIKRKDKTLVEVSDSDSFIINGNELDIKLKNSISAIAGPLECDLELSDSTGKMTTASFFINVKDKVLNGQAIEGTNEFDTFTKTAAKIEEDYKGLRRIIIDENQAANLQDQVNKTNAQLETKANELNKKIDTKANEVDLQVERSRIDNLSKLGEGSTTGDAELIDGRVDNSGTVYENIGFNIRSTQDGNKINYFKTALSLGYSKFVQCAWFKGNLDTSTGEPTTSSRYVYSSLIPLDKNVTLIAENGVYHRVYKYDSNGTMVNSGAFRNITPFTVNATDGYSIRIVLKIDNGSSVITDYNSVFTSLLVLSDLDKLDTSFITLQNDVDTINRNINVLDEKINDGLEILSVTFEQGTLQNGNPVSAGNRIRTKEFINVLKGGLLKVECSDDCQSCIIVYDSEENFIGNSEWVSGINSVENENNYKYKILLKEISSISIKPTFSTNCTISTETYLRKMVDKSKTEVENVVTRNKDIEQYLYNSNRYKFDYTKAVKDFSMMICTDVHGSKKQLNNMIEYSNYYKDLIDCNICLGDIKSGATGFHDDITYYTESLSNSEIDFLTVVGNHDAGNGSGISSCGTLNEVYSNVIQPNLQFANVNSSQCYYYKDFDDYKIRLIVLNQYEHPSDLKDDSTYLYSRSFVYYSQNEINWLLETLNNTPSNYNVIVAYHSPSNSIATNDYFNFENIKNKEISTNNDFIDNSIISDIINAWKNGISINEEYAITPSGSVSKISINYDFSARGQGEFICYLCGHRHYDGITKLKKHNDQIQIILGCTSIRKYDIYAGDNARINDTKSEDLFTMLSVDTENKKIKMVRIGANETINMTKREVSIINY